MFPSLILMIRRRVPPQMVAWWGARICPQIQRRTCKNDPKNLNSWPSLKNNLCPSLHREHKIATFCPIRNRCVIQTSATDCSRLPENTYVAEVISFPATTTMFHTFPATKTSDDGAKPARPSASRRITTSNACGTIFPDSVIHCQKLM